jgi:hypothetical protein
MSQNPHILRVTADRHDHLSILSPDWTLRRYPLAGPPKSASARLSAEKSFLRAMAELGPGSQRSGGIADTLKVKVTSLGPVRAKSIKRDDL